MYDVFSQHKSFLAAWVTRLLKENYNTVPSWKCIPLFYLHKTNLDKSIFHMNFDDPAHCPEIIGLPLFYKQAIRAWHEAGGGCSSPKNSTDVLKEVIWCNRHVQFKGKVLYFKAWLKSDILLLNDIIDIDGNFRHDWISNKLEDKSNMVCELFMLYNALPTIWRDLVKQETVTRTNIALSIPFVFLEHKCQRKSVYQMSTREYYWSFIENKIVKPWIINKWNRVLNLDPECNWSNYGTTEL